jgi:hypothetical protein
MKSVPIHEDVKKCAACRLLSPRSAERCDCGFDFVNNQVSHSTSAWFTVGEAKFVFMFVATFGLYQVYWFYRQWDHVRDTTGAKINPVARSIFSIVFCHALFKQILASSAPHDYHATRVNPGLLAKAYVFLTLAFRLPSFLSLMGFLSMVPLLSVVRVANASAVSHDPGAGMNRRLTLANLAWIGVAVVLVGVIAWGESRVIPMS